MDVTPRLSRWIITNFPAETSDEVLRQLTELPAGVARGQDPERIQAALVLGTKGSLGAFRQHLELARIDWRDLLMNADLADGSWPHRLDGVLGPV